MQFKHYIWDFDGTLFDSYPHMAGSLHKALKLSGADADPDEVMNQIKLSVTIAIAYFSEKYSLSIAELGEKYDQCESGESSTPPVPYPQAAEVCGEICKQGGHNYIYTHRDMMAVEYLKRHNMDKYFRYFITAENKFPSKPAPNAILSLVEQFNIPKTEAVMIGDRDIDVLSGTNAGIAGCLYDPDDFYSAFKADYTVRNMAEFMSVFLGK